MRDMNREVGDGGLSFGYLCKTSMTWPRGILFSLAGCHGLGLEAMGECYKYS